MDANDEYNKITQDFLTKMTRVKAPLSEYRAALRAAVDEIDIVLDADRGKVDDEAAGS